MMTPHLLHIQVSSKKNTGRSALALGQAESGGHDQDVQLADLEAQRSQGIVVQVRDDPVEEAQAHGDARLGDGVDVAGLGIVHDPAAPRPSRLLYTQVSAEVKALL